MKALKVLLIILQFVGIFFVMAGGAGMDSDSLIFPIVMVFGGLALVLASAYIEKCFVWGDNYAGY